MYRGFSQGMLPLKVAVIAGVLGWAVAGSAQDSPAAQNHTSKVSDAQVEASVLKSLAGASDLSAQPITTTTVYGVVTLSGSVQTEAMRTEAENLVARAPGVQKVVDEMTLGSQAQESDNQGSALPPPADNSAAEQPQSPPPPAQGQDQGQPYANQQPMPNYPGAPEYRQPYGDPQQPPSPGYGQYPQQQYPQQQYPQQSYGPPPGYGEGQSPYAAQQSPYPSQPGYGPQQQPGYGPQQSPYGNQQSPYGAQPGYGQSPYGSQSSPYAAQPSYGGQQGGQNVTVPAGALVRVRVNQPLDSGRAQPGQHFQGIVVNDVVADGAVAIPRGTLVEGTVVDARPSGSLKGRGELSLQLASITLGGTTYPIASEVWAHNGGDKTAETVDKTAIGAGLGGLVGAAAGGGEGAAVGAGIGAALGLGSSAASGRGQVFIPAEGLLTFHLAQPVTVATVSQLEMDRLAQGAGPGAGGTPRLQRRYPPAYYGPVYYYRPYPYYPYPRYYYPY